jgi:hypothetical protein
VVGWRLEELTEKYKPRGGVLDPSTQVAYALGVGRWRLTVRHGSEVAHEEFEDLDEAVQEMRRRALDIRAEGPLKKVSTLRDFEPGDQIHARLQISGKGLVRKPAAGVDVRGDGTFVPYRGAVRREELDPTDYDTPFDVVRETLAGEGR